MDGQLNSNNTFFEFLGEDITTIVEESRIKGDIFELLNSTFKALISKLDEPISFDDFIPISLCNCIYKIILKVIAVRLNSILSRNILKEKFGFLEGRKIH